jgi:hypothetical protein
VLRSLPSTIRYKKAYIWWPFYDEFSFATIETLADALAQRRSVGDLAAPSKHHVTLLCVTLPPRSLISSPTDRWSSSSMMPKVGATRPPLHILFRSPPLLEDPLGEFPSLCCVCRVKPRGKQCPVARAMPGSGEPPPRPRRAAAHCAATSQAPSQPSTPWSMS